MIDRVPWPALVACGLLLTAAAPPADDPVRRIPDAARKKLVGLPLDCQKAYASMRACMEKTVAAGAPESIRPQWERQLDEAIASWQMLKGQPAVQQLCREIAAKPDCSE